MIKTAETYHVPVLLKESVDGLNIQPGGIYVDVTFGGGGHSREIISRLSEGAHLYSFDQDADAERNWTDYSPTSAYRVIISTTSPAASPSALILLSTCA